MAVRRRIRRRNDSETFQASADRLWAAETANTYLSAYKFDPDPRHIAEAWLAWRSCNLAPTKRALAWVDQLAKNVLKPRRPKTRQRENLVRDLKIYLDAAWMRRVNASVTEAKIHRNLARNTGPKAGNIKQIIVRIERMFRDPYERPRSRR